MKIALNMTVELDAQAYAEDYGIELADVRADYLSYVKNALYSLAFPATSVVVR